MEIKKSPKADLENKKLTYHLVGYAVILAVLFVAFEWSNTEVTKKHEINLDQTVEFEEEIVNTFMATPPPPPPPAPPVIDEVIKIVEDDTELLTEVEIQSSEDDQNQAQEIVAPTVYGTGPAGGEEEPAEDEIFVVLEEMPSFPGGEAALMAYLQKNIQYPAIASENNIQGRVFCTFVVNKDGSVVDVEVLRGVDPSLDREAVRVLKGMPKWTPGKQRGKPVRARYSVPVIFRLR